MKRSTVSGFLHLSVAAFLVFFLGQGVLAASEQAMVCIKSRTEGGGWSEGHAVAAKILKGSELNQITQSLNFFASTTYVVVSGRTGKAEIIIQMKSPLLGSEGQSGTDPQGVEWQVAKRDVCA